MEIGRAGDEICFSLKNLGSDLGPLGGMDSNGFPLQRKQVLGRFHLVKLFRDLTNRPEMTPQMVVNSKGNGTPYFREIDRLVKILFHLARFITVVNGCFWFP